MNLCTLGQSFGQNFNDSYKNTGLKGHPGWDVSCGYGSPIRSLFAGKVYKVLTVEHPANDGSGFTGVFILVDDGIQCFEWLVGHCTPSVKAGDMVQEGDLIATELGTESNHGTVYSGNVQITLDMQAAGDTRGHHRHYQMRPVMKISKKVKGYQYLSDGGDNPYGFSYYDGSYYQVFDFYNGYNGCTDPTRPVFDRDLYFGKSGYDVYVLQRLLTAHGYFKGEATAFYGTITTKAVMNFQRDYGISPVLGYTGEKTRKVLNAMVPPPTTKIKLLS